MPAPPDETGASPGSTGRPDPSSQSTAKIPTSTGPASTSSGPGDREGVRRAPIAPPRRPGGPSPIAWALIGLALILAGVGALIVSGSYDKAREVAVIGHNQAVNEGASNGLDLSAHNSPVVVRNPTDASNLVVANRIDEPRYSCALHVSFDAGGHWSQTPIPVPAGEQPKCYAPDVAFDAKGTAYLLFTTLKGKANDPHAVWLSRSRDGGKTLSRPVKTPLPRDSFMPRLVTDPSKPARLFLTYLAAKNLGLYSFTTTGNPIEVIRSDDNGNTWSSPVQVSSSSRQRVVAPSPAIGPHGELYVLYLDLQGDQLDYEGQHHGKGGPPYNGHWSLVLARSTNGGQSWQESVVDDAIVPYTRFIVYSAPYPSIAVDQNSGRVYAAFTDAKLGDPNVYVWSLPSGANSWNGPTRVNDTSEHDGSAQYLPKLAVSQDGRLDVIYYDRRADPKDVLNETSFQTSFDQGDSFNHRINLSDRPFSSRVGFGSDRGMADLGNQLALVSTNDGALGIWTDTRAGTPRTGKQDLAGAVVGLNHPPRLAGWVKTLLRIAGILLILLGAYAILALAIGLGRGGRGGVSGSRAKPTTTRL